MFDGFWHGLFGGLFGPAIAQWMSRFKYWVIFLVAVFSWQLFFLVLAVWYKGWAGLNNIFTNDNSSFLIIFVYTPLGAGLFAVFVAFLGSSNRLNKNDEVKREKK